MPTPEPPPPSAATVDQVLKDAATAWLDHKEAAEKHTQLMREAGYTLLQHAQPGDRVEVVPGVGVKLQKPSATFSPGRAEQIIRETYPDTADEVLTACSETRSIITIQKTREVLPGAVFDRCKTSSDVPSIRII